MKLKPVILLLSVAAVAVILSFTSVTKLVPDEKGGAIHWYTFGEAVELQNKNPKIIMVDVYTSWCGPCKMMSAYTFGNEIIAKYLNEHFYPVKFDAETWDSVTFNGFVFKNNNPPGTQRPVHDFAISILDGKLSYPSVVFVDSDIKRVQTIVGLHRANEFEPIIKFLGSGDYKSKNFEEFKKTFVGEVK